MKPFSLLLLVLIFGSASIGAWTIHSRSQAATEEINAITEASKKKNEELQIKIASIVTPEDKQRVLAEAQENLKDAQDKAANFRAQRGQSDTDSFTILICAVVLFFSLAIGFIRLAVRFIRLFSSKPVAPVTAVTKIPPMLGQESGRNKMDLYVAYINEQQCGPFTLEDLLSYEKIGVVTDDTQIRIQDNDLWRTWSSVKEP